MALKTYNPVTPGQRQLVIVDRSTLHKGPPVKSLTEGQNATGGPHPGQQLGRRGTLPQVVVGPGVEPLQDLFF